MVKDNDYITYIIYKSRLQELGHSHPLCKTQKKKTNKQPRLFRVDSTTQRNMGDTSHHILDLPQKPRDTVPSLLIVGVILDRDWKRIVNG